MKTSLIILHFASLTLFSTVLPSLRENIQIQTQLRGAFKKSLRPYAVHVWSLRQIVLQKGPVKPSSTQT